MTPARLLLAAPPPPDALPVVVPSHRGLRAAGPGGGRATEEGLPAHGGPPTPALEPA